MPSFIDMMNDSGEDGMSAAFPLNQPIATSHVAALGNNTMFAGTTPMMMQMRYTFDAEPPSTYPATSIPSAPVVKSQASLSLGPLSNHKYPAETNGMIPVVPMGTPMPQGGSLYRSPTSSCASSMVLTPDIELLHISGFQPDNTSPFALQPGQLPTDYMHFSRDPPMESSMVYDPPFYPVMAGNGVLPAMTTPVLPSQYVAHQPEGQASVHQDYSDTTQTVPAPKQESVEPQTQPNESQRNAKTKPGRMPMPRRHTVSTPYHNTIRGKDPPVPSQPSAADLPQTDKRKQLKAKRHRSLGKIDIDSSAWMPETATVSSASSICSPGDAEGDRMGFGDHEMRSLMSAEDEVNLEDGKAICLWADCHLEFATLEELISHVKEVHIGSGKPFYYCAWKDCPRNSKPFTKRHKMHNHLRTHTGERPFECLEPGCGKRFSRPDSLTTHMKIHSNIRPHLCQFENCQKAYYHLRSLRKHERSHELQFFPTDEARMQHQSSTNVAHTIPNPDQTVSVANDNTMLEWTGMHI